MIQPENIKELVDIVQSEDGIIPVGAQTKGRLSVVDDRYKKVSLSGLSGITEYDPSEYTFTALAGTPVSVVQAALEEKGQFMPFAPLLRNQGATLGGVVASGLSGAGRFRYGGVRDFLLGVHFIDSRGVQLKSGGKVVKNAAGFDLPKLMVGSLGRLGILTEMTFKVFPGSPSTQTIRIPCDSHEQAAERIMKAGNARWELNALDYTGHDKTLYLRMSGPDQALAKLTAEIISLWGGEALYGASCRDFWSQTREMAWAQGYAAVAKVPISPRVIPQLESLLNSLTGVKTHYSGGGTAVGVAMEKADSIEPVNQAMTALELRGMVFCGADSSPLWMGLPRDRRLLNAIKDQLDPKNKFPSF